MGADDIPYDFLSRYLGGNPLIFPCQVAFNGTALNTLCLIDSGANGFLFVSVAFAKKMLRLLRPRRIENFRPRTIGGFDGKVSQIIDVALEAHFRLCGVTNVGVPFLVIDMKYDFIVGRRWFEACDMLIDCKGRTLLPKGEWSPAPPARDIEIDPKDHVLRPIQPEHQKDAERRNRLLVIEDKRRKDGERIKILKRLPKDTIDQVVLRIKELKASGNSPPPKSVLTSSSARVRFNPSIDDGDEEMVKELSDSEEADYRYDSDDSCSSKLSNRPPKPSYKFGQRMTPEDKKEADAQQEEYRRLHGHDGRGDYTLKKDGIAWTKSYEDLHVVDEATIFRLAESEGNEGCFLTCIFEIERRIQEVEGPTHEALPYDSQELIDMALKKVPKRYHHLLRTFSKAESDKLAPHRDGIDLKITINDGCSSNDLGFSPLYKMSLEELEIAKQYIMENLDKGFIEPSTAPWAAPILMAKKPGGGLRFCVDFRKLNAMTKKDVYPLPRIDETLAQLGRAVIFTKIDIRQAFHKVRLHPDTEDLAAFRTPFGAFKYKVMPFGLTNAPSVFQRYINGVLMDCLGEFCRAYVDDIIIYSNSIAEHERHVETVLKRLRDAGLQADIKKCEFHVTHTKFLGFVISTDGISTDPEKIEAVTQWKTPKTLKGVQSFLGFCNFYRDFIPEYSRVAAPLVKLSRKDVIFSWSQDCWEAFEQMKVLLTTSPVLAYFQYGLETKLETDASDGVVSGVLSQNHNGTWKPVGYYSETMHGAEMNYGIHDKELLAIVRSLAFWRAELIGLQQGPFEILTDHRALEFFSTKRLLNLRQAGWAEKLSHYNFTLRYRPGTENAAADGLSRKSEELRTQKEKQDAYRTMTIFRKETHDLSTVYAFDICYDSLEMAINGICESDAATPAPVPLEWSGPELVDAILRANREDPAHEQYREKAKNGHHDWALLDDRYVTYKDRLVVSETDNLRTKLIEDMHSRIVTSHPGRNKTRQLVSARYWWPRMNDTIDQYIANCICVSAKHPRDKTPGLLHPLSIPLRTWQRIVVDFRSMPKDKAGYDNLFVMIDRLSKTSWCVPCHRTATSKDAARMYYEGPFRIFGIPEEVTSDRGPQFVADFMNETCRILGVKWKLSSSGHSQTAGQAEVMNQYIAQRLRMFINHYQDNWSKAIPALDFTQSVLPHESLDGCSPHEIRFGHKARMHFDWDRATAY